jgi:hypothetical protein
MVPAIASKRIDRGAQRARRLGIGSSWSAIGLSVGHAIALAVPGSLATIGLPALFAVLFGGLYSIGVLGRLRRSPVRDLRADLREVDGMLRHGEITEGEFWTLRDAHIKAHALRRAGRE